MFDVVLFIIWGLIGLYNLIIEDNISKTQYFCTWIIVMVYMFNNIKT